MSLPTSFSSAGKRMWESGRGLPRGVGTAAAAARAGANALLLERYGHWSGMGTGGLVPILPNMSDINGKQQKAGLCKEWVIRLDLEKVNIEALRDSLGKQGVPLPNRT